MMRGSGAPIGDFAADVIRGLIPSVSRVSGLGLRTIATAISTAAAEATVWQGPTAAYPLMTGLTALEAVSDNAADTAAGAGMQALTFAGLDASYAPVSGTIALNGTTPVALGSVFRINSAVNTILTPTTGTQFNVGTITIRDVSGGTVRAVIPPLAGAMQQAIYTVPAGFTLTIYAIEAQILSSAGGVSRGADFALTFRNSNGAGTKPRQISCTDLQPYALEANTRIRVVEKTDFMISCIYTSNNNMKVGASFEAHLYRN